MDSQPIHIRRFESNPIIRPRMLPWFDGNNINGPSLMRAPDWLPGRLGAYYLYFAHHEGRYIRLAVADRLEGPWRVHRPGSLTLADAPGCKGHIASPDVHVDEAGRRIVMYFHGPVVREKRQASFVATSVDGVNFTARPEPVADFYLRVVPWRDRLIGMAKGGQLYLGRHGSTAFEPLPNSAFPMSSPRANAAGDVRHVALDCAGDRLNVYFTRIGDRPESIFRARIDLARPPSEWRAGDADLVLRPETAWEGVKIPLKASRSGPARGRENALRDPAIFREEGRTYLFYSVAGESGIGIAEVT
ncbi:MAG: hypothetical protein ABL866_13400 [Devosia sp.]